MLFVILRLMDYCLIGLLIDCVCIVWLWCLFRVLRLLICVYCVVCVACAFRLRLVVNSVV